MANDLLGAAEPNTGRALVIVDPIHSGFRLAKTAAKLGFEIIPLFTVPKHLVPEDVLAHFRIKTYNCEKDPSRAQRIIETERRRRVPDAPPLIAAVLPGAEPGVELAFALAELLGLPGNRATLPGAFRDKGTMRTALKLAGLPQPEFAVCADRDAAVHFARSAAFPLVVKAPASAGADNVFKCRDMAELEQRVAHVLGTPSVFGDFARYALVEEFIGGEEYVVDLLGFGDGTFSVMGCWRYSNLESFLKSSIVLLDPDLPVLAPLIEMAKASAEALGIRLGPVHCEVKDDPLRGPVLVEAGARMCGADLPRFYTYASGDTAYELASAAFLNEPDLRARATYEHRKNTAALILEFVLPGSAGVMMEVRGREALVALPSFNGLEMACSEGGVLVKPKSLVDQHAWVFLSNADEEALNRDMKLARGILDVSIEPLPDLLQTFIDQGLDPSVIVYDANSLKSHGANSKEIKPSILPAFRPRSLHEVEQINVIANDINRVGVKAVRFHPFSTSNNSNLWPKLSTLELNDFVLDLQYVDQTSEINEPSAAY